MRTVGNMWGTGLFKANACDFCDDVTTELADISLGDAWLAPYNQDGRGANVIVTRSDLADKIIHESIAEGKTTIASLPIEKFLASQQGSFNHRQKGLSYRIKQAHKKKTPIPPKRFDNEKVTIDFKVVQKLRRVTRKKSLEVWKHEKNSNAFDAKLKKSLNHLKFVTRMYHYRRNITNRLKKYL